MIGGWQSYIRYQVKVMYGNQKDGSQIVEKSISNFLSFFLHTNNAIIIDETIIIAFTSKNKSQ